MVIAKADRRSLSSEVQMLIEERYAKLRDEGHPLVKPIKD